jgi:putative DNA primase/helicase
VTDWADNLEPHGWTVEHRGPGHEVHWTRPGKSTRDGASATTGRAQDRDRLYVFSTSTAFEAEVPYTKFGAYALLNHGSDFKAAVLDLVSKGFGDQRPLPALLDDVTRPMPVSEDKEYTLDDLGNGERFADLAKGRFRWVFQEKAWFTWSTERWVIDHEQLLIRAWDDMCRRMIHKGRAENDKALEKWGNQSRAMAKFKAGTEAAKAYGLTYSSSDFDQQRHKLNLENGTLNLRTGDFTQFQAEDLITHQFGANYAPAAECPNWESFMEKALPDVQLRSYVQRALGYSLLGDADQRAMFILYGPSGTGKSTMLETINEIFGTYGTTAQAGTFKMSRNEKAPNNDLHELRGRRFVTTSETAENASFDEDLLKRVTGRDKVRSRALYQESVEWTPELTLWLATNNPPRLNSDDNAIWSRVKLIPFQTVFLGEGQVFDYARKHLIPEAAGILNWLLRGLIDFQENGLGEPAALAEYAREQRMASDSVARFVTDRLSDGSLVASPESTVKATELFVQYVSWCRESGEKSLGSRRFGLRLESLGYIRLHGSGPVLYQGLLRPQGTWLVSGT